MRLLAIACEVLFREMSYAAAVSPNVVDLRFLPKGLHDEPTKMPGQLQEAIDQADPQLYDAVALGYALCSNGVVGVHAHPQIPLVIPRAHDCITLFLGSLPRYLQRFREKPGTYYYTAGWIERGGLWMSSAGEALREKLAEYIANYGEDNGRYLFDLENQWQQNYTTAALIKMPPLADQSRISEAARKSAAEYGWEYEEMEGDDRLFHALLAGDWDENEFLVVPPGGVIAASPDDGIMRCACPESV